MKTKVGIVRDITKDEDKINEAAAIIKQGGTVVFPTETVYGLGADALNSNAVEKIFKAKGRPQDNPLIIHVSSLNIDKYVKDIPDVANIIMKKFWPGPLTLIFNKKNIVPNVTSANLDTIGVRMPEDPIALKLIELSETTIAAPSANISGRPSPTDVIRCIEDLDGKVDYILGGDKSEVGVESTILDLTVNPPCVLRPGGITLEMLREIDENIYIDPAILEKSSKDLRPKAPGMKYRHYAPKAKVIIVSGNIDKSIEKINELVQNYIEIGQKVGLMITKENIDKYEKGHKIVLGSNKDLSQVAQNLFEALRCFDDEKCDIVISESFKEVGVGVAIMNRLKKAAGYNIIKVD